MLQRKLDEQWLWSQISGAFQVKSIILILLVVFSLIITLFAIAQSNVEFTLSSMNLWLLVIIVHGVVASGTAVGVLMENAK